MKNGIEIRSNGNTIKKKNEMYYVYILINKTLVLSRDGPWDYLRNARGSADKSDITDICISCYFK